MDTDMETDMDTDMDKDMDLQYNPRPPWGKYIRWNLLCPGGEEGGKYIWWNLLCLGQRGRKVGEMALFSRQMLHIAQ
jgi:hypothetical protein